MTDGITEARRAQAKLDEELGGNTEFVRWDPVADRDFAAWSILDLISRYGETFPPNVQETFDVLRQQLVTQQAERSRTGRASGTRTYGRKGARKGVE